jgi:hypothetical protein
MHCPNCNAETSEMLTSCEWCGAPLAGGPSPPGDAFAAPPPPGGMPPPSDASYQANGVPVSEWPPPSAGGRPAPELKKAWYLTPWPYVAALVVVVAVLGFLFFAGGAKAYPELVVGNQPTLVDVYTDT